MPCAIAGGPVATMVGRFDIAMTLRPVAAMVGRFGAAMVHDLKAPKGRPLIAQGNAPGEAGKPV